MISGPVDVIGRRAGASVLAALAARWVYVFMGGFFIITALAGFIPDSVALLSEVRAHARPPLPLVLHVHALLMGSWLLLLFAQTLLVATGRRSLHRKIGAVALLLAPLILVSMVSLVRIGFEDVATVSTTHAAGSAEINGLRLLLSSLLPEQVRAALFFGVFTAWALFVRNKDPQAH